MAHETHNVKRNFRTRFRTAPTAKAPAKAAKPRKQSTLRPEGSGYTRRSLLWAELKRLAPEKAAKLSHTRVSMEQPEPLVEEAREGKWL